MKKSAQEMDRPDWIFRAYKIISIKDSGPFRQLILQKLLGGRPCVNLIYRALEVRAVSWVLNPAAIFFALVCSLRLRVPHLEADAGIFAISGTENEFQAIRSGAESLCPGRSMAHITVERIPAVDLDALRFLARCMGRAELLRLLKFSQRVYRRHGALVWLRVFAALGYSWRFRDFFERHPPKVLLISTGAAPYTLALLPWTASQGIETGYFEHGLPTPVHTPVEYSRVHLWGERSLQLYRRHTRVRGLITLYGGASRDLVLPRKGDKITLGIFPGLTTNWDALKELVDLLRRQTFVETILIKPHPNRYLYSARQIRSLKVAGNVVILDRECRLENPGMELDLLISGNSSIHLDALRKGVPSLYASWIDDAPEDFYGFVESRLVPCLRPNPSNMIEEVREFYSSVDWVQRRDAYLAPRIRTVKEPG